jgi:NADPH:quinone reductase-like Zn-dependent oxidoreductase
MPTVAALGGRRLYAATMPWISLSLCRWKRCTRLSLTQSSPASTPSTGGMGRQLRALARSPFTRQRLTMLISRQRGADLETLARLIEAGQLTPVIGKTYPLHQAPDAMRHLQAGHARGKLVLTVTGAG